MGLFDYLKCKYPLPGNAPEFANKVTYHTKDLTCYMEHYEITENGKLAHTSGTEDYGNYTGTVEFSWTNVCGSGPGLYTEDGKDAHFLGYRAAFVSGKLIAIEEVENTKQPAAPRDLQSGQRTLLTPETIAEIRDRRSEALLGRTIVVWWGGSKPYTAKVIAENTDKLVVAHLEDSEHHKSGDYELIDRIHRDTCFFDSLEDGRAYERNKKADWAERQRVYQEHIAAKTT